jgi:dTDP-4-dehydrorhamnose reductase
MTKGRKILLLGSAGQLGSLLLQTAPDGADIVALDRTKLI